MNDLLGMVNSFRVQGVIMTRTAPTYFLILLASLLVTVLGCTSDEVTNSGVRACTSMLSAR